MTITSDDIRSASPDMVPSEREHGDEALPQFEFTVRARDPGTKAMSVKAGDTWSFSAAGRWRDLFISCGPDGYRNFLADILQISPRVVGQNLFCLCGEVTSGDEIESFSIGRGCTHEFKSDGELVLFANDVRSMYWNNSGAVMVTAKQGGVAPSIPDTDPTDFDGLTGKWRLIRRTMEMTRGTGTLAILVLGACLVLALLPQGIDLVRSIGDDSFGAPTHELVAFVLGLLFLGIQSWLWPRLLIDFNYGMDREQWRPRTLLEWTPRALGMAPFLLVFIALLMNSQRSFGLPIVLVIVAAGFLLVLYYREDWTRRLIKREGWTERLRGSEGRTRFAPWWIVTCLVVAAIVMVVATLETAAFGHALGAPAVVFIGLGLIIPPMMIAIQSGHGVHLPIVGVTLTAAVVFSLWMDNHDVGGRAFGRGPGPLPLTSRPSLADAYKIWRSKQPEPGDGRLTMVLVASEGGASRAGDWTAEVLGALQEQSGGKLASRLFAISSVSGGSVGAVGYSALLHAAPKITPDVFAKTLPQFTGKDALSPTLTGLLFPDLLQRFLPYGFLPDRAEALERAWEVGWDDTCPAITKDTCRGLLEKGFLTLGPREGQPWRPILIVNGASEETGRRILTSSVDLGDAVDADDFHKIVRRDVQISTAISNGARFPWISPAGTLRRDGKRQGHILDGGYFDAAGVATLSELAQGIAAVAGKDRLHFIFVFIGYRGAIEVSLPPGQQPEQHPLPSDTTSKPASMGGQSPQPPEAQSQGARLLNEVKAPLLGLFASRTGHEAHIMSAFRTRPAPAGTTGEFVPLMLCNGAVGGKSFEPPMDWALSGAARKFIHDALGSEPAPDIPCASANATALKQITSQINK